MNVVITGSTRGIGHGLATEYLRRGHAVMVSGRDADAVERSVADFQREFPGAKVAGQRCDVSDEGAVQALWDVSVAAFGSVDCWINNAGVNNPKQRIDEMPLAAIHDTLRVNLNGMINGSMIALRGMQAQGAGWIWNMEGFGSDGMLRLEQVPYGLSKYGLRYFTKALVKTAAGTGVKVGYLQPGIVTTRMAVPPQHERGAFFEANKKVLDILADHVETVTPWLVEKMLAAEKNGAAVRWLTGPKAATRFLLSPLRRRGVIDEAVARGDK